MSATPSDVERIPTFVKGLDPRMEGGIPKGSVMIIEGPAGSMKSTLAYSILHYNALKNGKSGLYVTIEQPASEIEAQMTHIGMNRRSSPDLLQRVRFLDLGQVRSFLAQSGENEREADWFASILTQIKTAREKSPLDLVVLDSLNGVFALEEDSEPRLALFHFVSELKELGLTTLLIHEVGAASGSEEGVAGFLADGIIVLERKRVEETVSLQLAVTKLRKTSHDHSYFPFLARQGMLEVVTR